jgi:putative ABC transport system ATP-binding protein
MFFAVCGSGRIGDDQNKDEGMPDIIRLDKLTKDYTEGGQTRRILEDCSFAFAEGQFTAIRGRSGSGKSTLLNLIACIDTPTSGDVYIGETCVTRLSARDRTLFRRDHLGFVFQFFNLIPTLTVLENVILPAELANRAVNGTQKRALDLLERVGLADRRAVFPDKLSGGEQQRVAIARALLQNPRVVLADEPTGNLDEKTGLEIMHLLDEMTRQAGRTLIMVTHSRQIAALADVVLTIHDRHLIVDPQAAGVKRSRRPPMGDA